METPPSLCRPPHPGLNHTRTAQQQSKRGLLTPPPAQPRPPSPCPHRRRLERVRERGVGRKADRRRGPVKAALLRRGGGPVRCRQVRGQRLVSRRERRGRGRGGGGGGGEERRDGHLLARHKVLGVRPEHGFVLQGERGGGGRDSRSHVEEFGGGWRKRETEKREIRSTAAQGREANGPPLLRGHRARAQGPFALSDGPHPRCRAYGIMATSAGGEDGRGRRRERPWLAGGHSGGSPSSLPSPGAAVPTGQWGRDGGGSQRGALEVEERRLPRPGAGTPVRTARGVSSWQA